MIKKSFLQTYLGKPVSNEIPFQKNILSVNNIFQKYVEN